MFALQRLTSNGWGCGFGLMKSLLLNVYIAIESSITHPASFVLTSTFCLAGSCRSSDSMVITEVTCLSHMSSGHSADARLNASSACEIIPKTSMSTLLHFVVACIYLWYPRASYVVPTCAYLASLIPQVLKHNHICAIPAIMDTEQRTRMVRTVIHRWP